MVADDGFFCLLRRLDHALFWKRRRVKGAESRGGPLLVIAIIGTEGIRVGRPIQ